MALTLGSALRLLPTGGADGTSESDLGISVAFVGAGGKTTSLFSLARELPVPSLVTTTTHFGEWQLAQADARIVASLQSQVVGLGSRKVTAVTGPAGVDQRMSSVSRAVLNRLRRESLEPGWPLLIEADGARQKPLKAPRKNEPQVPEFVEAVVVVAGMSGLGRRLDEETVHGADAYASLAGLRPGELINSEAISRALRATRGGLKGVPERARRIALLNQADTPELQSQALRIGESMRTAYDAIVVATASSNTVHAVLEPCAGIVLAAGGATRFGGPKQVLLWRGEPLVRAATRTAINAGLSPVIVVTGAYAEEVEAAIRDLPVIIARNEGWENGQSSSIVTGLAACPPATCAAVFLLADQPLSSPDLIRALVDVHAAELAAIVAPIYQGDRRGSPVLFDRQTFAELRALRGDTGGRALFSKNRVQYVPWQDPDVARDIDTHEDYRLLVKKDHT